MLFGLLFWLALVAALESNPREVAVVVPQSRSRAGSFGKRRFSTVEKLRVLVALGTKYPKTIVPGVLGAGTCGLEEQ